MTEPTAPPDEQALLTLEVDTVFGLVPGAPGRPPRVRAPGVRAVWAWSPGAWVWALGEGAYGAHATGPDLGAPPFAPEEPPPGLADLAVPGTSVVGGPTWVFPDAGVTAPPVPERVLVSDEPGRQAAAALARPDTWEPDEWAALVAGAAGEWAMAVREGRPVSICHTPAASRGGVEAGTWTAPEHRGRGLARATAAAWSRRAAGRVRFYSTMADNTASRAVATGLGLRPLGWLWSVR
ncbi:GNAT family N-acetyltransferase [Streptomyces sp. NPDC050560]|uniref:GNAT family N-acetyltransferase n=1 Tax=Streptomyces sp. NPDC050560 TaxID=3365630 RepID=UPI0037ABD063